MALPAAASEAAGASRVKVLYGKQCERRVGRTGMVQRQQSAIRCKQGQRAAGERSAAGKQISLGHRMGLIRGRNVQARGGQRQAAGQGCYSVLQRCASTEWRPLASLSARLLLLLLPALWPVCWDALVLELLL